MEKAHNIADDLLKIAATIKGMPPAVTYRMDVFTPGIYTRLLRMTPGLYITEKHKTQHPYHVLAGRLKVWTEEKGWEIVKAGYFGITEPGTQRIFVVEEETVWVTTHACSIVPEDDSPEAFQKAVAEITGLIIEHVKNPYLEQKAESRKLKAKSKKEGVLV